MVAKAGSKSTPGGGLRRFWLGQITIHATYPQDIHLCYADSYPMTQKYTNSNPIQIEFDAVLKSMTSEYK